MAGVERARREQLFSAPLPLSDAEVHTTEDGGEIYVDNVIVTLGGHRGESYAVALDELGVRAQVRKLGENLKYEGEVHSLELGELDYHPMSNLARGEIDGVKQVVQILGETNEGVITVQMEVRVCEAGNRRVTPMPTMMLVTPFPLSNPRSPSCSKITL